MRILIICILIAACNTYSLSQISKPKKWVDSIMQELSLDEKLGQLFVIRSFSNNTYDQCDQVEKFILDYNIGGVCFFKGTSTGMIALINQYQAMSKVPLLMSMDAEWGVGMRLTDISSFPKQISLGAIEDNRWIYKMGREIARQMKDLGLHMNYAPVLDINNNIQNPVINERSFSSNRKKVIAKSFAYMQGLQDGGVLASLKHFPGHGDTETDSHYDLPLLSHSIQRLDSIELYPFKALMSLHPASVMIAHLHIPALDTAKNIPVSLSEPVVGQLLRKNYNYKGLVITDALEMKGVTKNYSASEIVLKAFKAGNDIFLLSEDIPASINALKTSILNGDITLEELNAKVRRILEAKFAVGLSELKPIELSSGWHKNSHNNIQVLKHELYKRAITLARDSLTLVPLRNIPEKIICLAINVDNETVFQKRLRDYANVCNYNISNTESLDDQLLIDLAESDLVILSLHKLNYNASKNYGLKPELINLLNKLINGKKCIISIFGCPYVSMFFPGHASLLLTYEENTMTMDLAAQMIFGTDPIMGVSPVNTTQVLEEGKGIKRPSLMRLGYKMPETQGINSDSLAQIDSIVTELIQSQAAPGCQVVVAKNNQIVYSKSFGYHDYDSTIAVSDSTLYDLASLTKIVATAPIVMLLESQNKLRLGNKFSKYFPEFNNSNKADLTLKDFFLHQGRLQAWIPFYKLTLIAPDTFNKINYQIYDTVPSAKFSIPVTEKLFLRNDYRDTIFQRIIDSKILDEKKYQYSDLGFYFFPKLVEQLSGERFESFFSKNFAKTLGLTKTVFNPLLHHIPAAQITPTENDNYYRQQIIQGTVHDMGAAMLGGISGHAGLFSNALEVSRIMQMFLNLGNYGGIEILPAESISRYTDRDSEFKRRALIFDMPELIDTSTAYVSSLASKRTYGHQGFTGTCAWVDPVHQLVYVFLSNRTYPDGKINLLHKYRYRMKIQDVIYRAMIKDREEGMKGLRDPDYK